MPVIGIDALPDRLQRGARLMGLDLGTKTIGLALSDVLLSIATPLETVRRRKFADDAARLVTLVSERGVGALVLGLPVSMDGTEGPRCQSTRQFAENLLERIDIPIVLWDERLSTAAVQRFLIDDADLSRKKREAVVDRAAAAWILQGALDRLAAMRRA